MEGLLGFVLAGLALAGSPGPATLSLAAAGAAFGARGGLGYLAGIVAGMVAVMAVTASGVVGVLLAAPGATPVVTAAAALYFAWLALRIATAPPLGASPPGAPPPAARPAAGRPSFAGGLFLSLVNPKGYAAMAALFSGFVLVKGHLALDAAAKGSVLAAIITAVSLAWLLAGAALTRLFRDPAAGRAINVAFALLLLASVAVLLPF
ncbi:MAG: LysE family transporter [Alphaproteobacteria bacterium]|nr:LysE family transporter [Alphaproteobacteria bacterium]